MNKKSKFNNVVLLTLGFCLVSCGEISGQLFPSGQKLDSITKLKTSNLEKVSTKQSEKIIKNMSSVARNVNLGKTTVDLKSKMECQQGTKDCRVYCQDGSLSENGFCDIANIKRALEEFSNSKITLESDVENLDLIKKNVVNLSTFLSEDIENVKVSYKVFGPTTVVQNLGSSANVGFFQEGEYKVKVYLKKGRLTRSEAKIIRVKDSRSTLNNSVATAQSRTKCHIDSTLSVMNQFICHRF